MGCSTHSEKMKVFAVLTSVLALASAQDWTCDECAEASVAVGDFLSADYNIASEVAILIEQLCPQHPDPEDCATNMPHSGEPSDLAFGRSTGCTCVMTWSVPVSSPLSPAVRRARDVSMPWLMLWPGRRPSLAGCLVSVTGAPLLLKMWPSVRLPLSGASPSLSRPWSRLTGAGSLLSVKHGLLVPPTNLSFK